MKYDRALSCLQKINPPAWSRLRRVLQFKPIAQLAHQIKRCVLCPKTQAHAITDNPDIVGVIVHSDAYRGDFEMHPRGHLLGRIIANRWENHLATFVSQVLEPDDDVIDVGANIGLFSLLTAKTSCFGRVLAIEPSPEASSFLTRNLVRNQVENVIVFEGAAAAMPGSETLNVIPGLTEYSSLGLISHPAVANRQSVSISVAARTVDELVAEHQLRPKLIKIDVEGAELDVLRGAQRTLSVHRPLLISEVDCRLLPNRDASAESIRAFLERDQYQLFNASTGAALRTCRGFIGEIIALPSEKLGLSTDSRNSAASNLGTMTDENRDEDRRTSAA